MFKNPFPRIRADAPIDWLSPRPCAGANILSAVDMDPRQVAGVT